MFENGFKYLDRIRAKASPDLWLTASVLPAKDVWAIIKRAAGSSTFVVEECRHIYFCLYVILRQSLQILPIASANSTAGLTYEIEFKGNPNDYVKKSVARSRSLLKNALDVAINYRG